MSSPDADVLPERSLDELRAEVGRRAVHLRRRRRTVAGAPIALVAAALLGLGLTAGSDSVGVDTVEPADHDDVEVDGGDDPNPASTTPDGDPASTPDGAEPSEDDEATPTTVSDDGSEEVVVFASDRSGAMQLWWMPLGGGEAVQVTNGDGAASDPDVLPGGDVVAYVHTDGDSTEIRFVALDGGLVNLEPIADGRGPAWSPDGRRLAYAARGDIWTIELGTGTVTKVTDGGQAPVEADPAWSPDGTRLAFARYDADGDGGGDVVVADADGSNARSLARVVAMAPAWSPDGDHLAFVDLSTAPGRLAVVGVDGSGMKTITGADAWAGRPAWTPEGDRIVYDRDPDGHLPPSCLLGVYDGQVVNQCLPSSDGPEHAQLWSVVPDGTDGQQLSSSGANDADADVARVDR